MSAVPSSLRRPRARRARLDLAEARWVAVAAVLAIVTGVLSGVAPLVPLGLIGLIVAGGAFTLFPAVVVLAILALRPSLDAVADLASFGGVNVIGLIALGTVAGGSISLLARRPALPVKPALLVAGAFLAFALLSLGWSFVPSEGLSEWTQVAFPLIMFLLTATVVRNAATFRRLVVVVLASAVVPIVFGLVQIATGQRLVKEGFASIQGPFVHPNGFGLFLFAVLSVGAVALLELRPGRTRTWLIVGVGLGLLCFMQTYARSAWVALAMVLMALALTTYRRLLPAGAILLVVAAVAFPSLVGEVGGRFADLSPTSASYANNSVSWRQDYWARMLPYAYERPATGHGIGTFLELSNREIGIFDYEYQTPGESLATIGVYPHNDFVYWAVELGAPGVLLWAATLVAMVLAAWRGHRVPELRPYAVAVSVALVALIVVSFFDNVKDYQALLVTLFALAGGLAGAAHHTRRAPSAPLPAAP